MNATNSDLVFAENGPGKCCCDCGSPSFVFRSVWDRLCKQLFEAMPPGMDPDEQLPNINIWDNGVALVDDSYPYTFLVTSDGVDSPKPADVIEYKGKYYVIGEVN